MDSVITRALDNKKLKKKKSPKNRSLKDEYAKFLKKDASKARRKLKKPSLKKKVNITENKKNPIFIKTGTKKPTPKKQEQKKPKKKKTKTIKKKRRITKKKKTKKPEPKKPTPKKQVLRRSKKRSIISVKSKRRFSKKSKRRKLDKKHTKSRKISFKCYPQKNKNIGDVMKKAEKLSEEQMKKELLSNGIEIKGTKNKLLKDIYMFSSLGGIKIQKE